MSYRDCAGLPDSDLPERQWALCADFVLHPGRERLDLDQAVAGSRIDGFLGPSQSKQPARGTRTATDGLRRLSALADPPNADLGVPAAAPIAEISRAAVPNMISVVICAYTEKRWSETCAAVESVRTQSFPRKEIVVVVDHNPVLYTSLADAFPDVMVVENREERGLSGGKNTGVAIAQGDVVAFLDDDAVADHDWLNFFADSYADPAVIGVGGLTLPNWKMPHPSWFPTEFYWVVGCTYRGMPETRSPVRNLLGGNASFRRSAFDLAGGFRNGIGRSAGKRPLGCEETEFCIRLSQRSPESVLLYDNRAIIWHLVPAERCRFSYFRSRCYAEGLSKALVTASVGASQGLSSERRYTTRTLPSGVARGVEDVLRGDSSGLGRAGAIVTGLAAATAGYSVASMARLLRPVLAAIPAAGDRRQSQGSR